jgi:uncharacterized protein YbjT (DUF2867 family)
MTFNVDVVPRGRNEAVTERIVYEGGSPRAWTDEDVAAVLKEILGALDRVVHPESDARPVSLRGLSWIVEPSDGQVVIAIEIGEGAAVAGPFDVEQDRLTSMIARVIAQARSASPGGARLH